MFHPLRVLRPIVLATAQTWAKTTFLIDVPHSSKHIRLMKKPPSRPTVHDLAKAANVSLATIDRVLNERPGVREKTISKVHEAITRIGFVRDLNAANLARQRSYRLVFVLPDKPMAHIRKLRNAIQEARLHAIADRTEIDVVTVPVNDPFKLTAILRDLEGPGIDGIAIMAPETPNVRDAIRHLKEHSKAVAAIISDLPNSERDHFIGINNIAAGRTAGQLLGRFVDRKPAQIVVIASSISSRDQIERRLGFDQVIHETFPSIEVLPTIVGWDEPDLIAEILGTLLEQNPAVRGVYSMGAGNIGVTRALERRSTPTSISVVGHEVTPSTRQALEKSVFDAVVAQDFGHVVRSAIRVLRAQSDRHEIIASQERIRIEVITKENLPEPTFSENL